MTRNVRIAAANMEKGSGIAVKDRKESVTLYIARWSPECRVAVRFLEHHGIAHRTIDVDSDTEAAAVLREATGSRRLPVLRVGSEWIRACSPQEGFLETEVSRALGLPVDSG
jgi:glutaredoxin